MFQGFSQQTGDFFWALAMNNDRTWFKAHKDEFEAVLNQPFRALANETLARMQARWPDFAWEMHISRIYRDARRLFGRGPYKDHLWYAIQVGDHRQGGPTFWFELNGMGWSCGMGWWDPSADHAEVFRACVDADLERFSALVRDIQTHGGFRLWGEAYKRPKGDRGALLNPWYNRKNISVGIEQGYGGVMYTGAMPEAVMDVFDALMPMYRFFGEVWNEVLIRRAGRA